MSDTGWPGSARASPVAASGFAPCLTEWTTSLMRAPMQPHRNRPLVGPGMVPQRQSRCQHKAATDSGHTAAHTPIYIPRALELTFAAAIASPSAHRLPQEQSPGREQCVGIYWFSPVYSRRHSHWRVASRRNIRSPLRRTLQVNPAARQRFRPQPHPQTAPGLPRPSRSWPRRSRSTPTSCLVMCWPRRPTRRRCSTPATGSLRTRTSRGARWTKKPRSSASVRPRAPCSSSRKPST